ncbi:TolC family protein [soil metagenome]
MAVLHSLKLKPIAIGVAVILLSGCASFTQDGGVNDVSSLTQQRVGMSVSRMSQENAASTNTMIASLLAEPLTADSAVRIALANNKALQATLAELGVAEADLVQASRIGNPSFSFGRLRDGQDIEIDRSIMFNIVGLVTLPTRRGIERGRFEQVKLLAASEAVKLAVDTRRAYYYALAAQQSVRFMEQVKTSAEAGAELAQRMAKVGNFSALDFNREQVFYAETTAQLARTGLNAISSREQLTRLMGLWGDQVAFKLPSRLPDLPKTISTTTDLESLAMQQRLDVQIAKRDAEATASALGLTKMTRFINVLDAGYQNKNSTGKPRANGYQVSLEIPLFDWGSARVKGAEARYLAAVERTADTAIRARSEVREAYVKYRTTYELARHYRDEIVPLRKKIADDIGLRYNGMLISVFELLADARDQANSVNASIEAQRDYWLAETELQMAINGTGVMNPELTNKSTTSDTKAAH